MEADGWSSLSGHWRHSSGEFVHDADRLPDNNCDWHFHVNTVEVSDGIFEGSVRLPLRNGDNSGRLVVRYGERGAYELGLGGWNSHLAIGRYVRAPDRILGAYALATTGTTDQIRFGEQHRFRVEFVGPHLRLQLDGHQVLAVEDVNPLTEGRVGLETWGATSVVFSNLSLYRIDLGLVRLVGILNRFSQALKREASVPQDESSVQRILWTMLRSQYDDLEDEEVLGRFGLKHYRDDFGIPSLRAVVEVKYIQRSTDFKKVQEEIMVDAVGYFSRIGGRYDSLIVFVYNASGRAVPESFRCALEGIEVIQRVVVSGP